jgi:tripartite-type tricarboxylate transporter receptor subunit TctC
MKFHLRNACLISLGLLAAANSAAAAELAYPTKPVRYVLPYPPGGSTDPMARYICAKLSELWNQSVIVDNRPGGNTLIGTEALVRSTPDGYTIGWAGASMFSTPTLLPNPSSTEGTSSGTTQRSPSTRRLKR